MADVAVPFESVGTGDAISTPKGSSLTQNGLVSGQIPNGRQVLGPVLNPESGKIIAKKHTPFTLKTKLEPLRLQNVAVIGAGISGVTAAAHFKRAGLSVTVFERSSAAGGNWLYDERIPLEPRYPSVKATETGFFEDDIARDADSEETEASLILKHAPPGPCYDGLQNNVPTPLLRTTLLPWPEDTPDIVNHRILGRYIRDIAETTGITSMTEYDTNVESVKKVGKIWQVNTRTLLRDREVGKGLFEDKTWDFDAVVVASGHYHHPIIPDISGLEQWKRRWPSRVQHSKGYRRPEVFADKNVFILGAGVSSTDIAKEAGLFANKIYQSSRGGPYDLPASMLPPNAHRVGAIGSFDIGNDLNSPTLAEDEPIPFTITLKSGHKLCNIHHVIVATGYHISFPYLEHLHNDTASPQEADETVLVTDGSQVHNLHKDIWYIPDPTLAFVGVPFYTATFTLFEFQAIAVAAVFAGKAKLPSVEAMKVEYEARVLEKGYGRNFHSLRNMEVEYVNEIFDWLNCDGTEHGLVYKGHSAEWIEGRKELGEQLKKRMASKEQDPAVIEYTERTLLMACG